jgi:alkylation response protein AidB-like acyl-CoA dehydrogenase
MTGLTRFNEVFLDEVRIPNANVIGDVNDGWSVAMTTLMYERGGRGGSRRRASVDEILVRLAHDLGLADDAVVRDRLAAVYLRQFVLDRLRERVVAGQCRGADTGSAGSLVKLATSGVVKGAAELGYDLGARGGAAWEHDSDAAARWSQQLLQSRMSSIAGGTDEVQRNIIGERLLGLPREPGDDARVPFNQRLQ